MGCFIRALSIRIKQLPSKTSLNNRCYQSTLVCGFICQKMAIFEYIKFSKGWKSRGRRSTATTATSALSQLGHCLVGPDFSALCHLQSTWGDITAETPGSSLRPPNTQSPASSQGSRKNSTGSFSLTANVCEKIHLCQKSA